jgi:hypothetical protein
LREYAVILYEMRTRDCFGQLWGCYLKSWPNVGLLRTTLAAIHENLAELRAASDNIGANIRKASRTQSCFGQLWGYYSKSCPNSGLLRTALAQIYENLSELGATSDSFGANTREAVRTRGCFGQPWRKYTKSCPNSGLLRFQFS